MHYKYIKRSILCTDAIRIDWKNAMKEAECLIKKRYTSFEDRLAAYKIYCDIKQFYNFDDVYGYLNYLDEHRSVLKSNSIREK